MIDDNRRIAMKKNLFFRAFAALLAGYAAYKQHVHYRLIPFSW